MDWNRLRIFQTVAEHGSFTRAGDILELSQSAVSRQIAALEKSLGAVLFHRHSRGLLLTEQGEALYRTVREVSAKLAMTEAQITDARDRPSGPLEDHDDGLLRFGLADAQDPRLQQPLS